MNCSSSSSLPALRKCEIFQAFTMSIAWETPAMYFSRLLYAIVFGLFTILSSSVAADHIRDLQKQAIEDGRSDIGHWGNDPEKYTQWGTHTNRLVPVYTFGTHTKANGVSLADYTGENSPYRSAAALRKIFGQLPSNSVHPKADYLDQTNIYDIQRAGFLAGKKHIFLVVFDGMDWQTTQAAAVYQTQSVYKDGRGNGLHFQDYNAGGNTEYGWMVTSPYCNGMSKDVNQQTTKLKSAIGLGGYSGDAGGMFPWSVPTDANYPTGKASNADVRHSYTDSASSATSMTSGIKTYNAAINIGPNALKTRSIAHLLQAEGWKVGAVTSVPISHATPAASYAHNVSRNDYQDLTRDMLGLPSISHPHKPLPGLDVLIGCGSGEDKSSDSGQGKNYVPGNRYLSEQDLQKIDSRAGGNYIVAKRTEGQDGAALLSLAADDAIAKKQRLFGYFGVKGGHLPFQTADGDYNPTVGRSNKAEAYSDADRAENPTLADFTEQAIRVLHASEKPFWLMVEAGDVDWANHDNNLDNSIGAVLSGDAAVKKITHWVDEHSNWDESLLIVTADHGHYLVLKKPEMLISK